MRYFYDKLHHCVWRLEDNNKILEISWPRIKNNLHLIDGVDGNIIFAPPVVILLQDETIRISGIPRTTQYLVMTGRPHQEN